MAKGKRYAAELRVFQDERTGARVRQLTNRPAIHHHPFFYVPAYTGDGRSLIVVSHRTGRPEIYQVETATGCILQLTERAGIGEWSLHPAWEGSFVLYIAGEKGYRVDLQTLGETEVADFAAAEGMRDEGMVGAAMGVTALSRCDRYWAVRVNCPAGAGLIIVDLQTGRAEAVLERDEIGHLSFCPDDSSLLFAARSMKDRVWLVNRDGSGERRLYRREPGAWITHETWIPGRRELAVVDWPHGVLAIDAGSGAVRKLAGFNAWHAVSNRQGSLMVADTNFPDIGLQVFDPRPGAELRSHTLCYPKASNAGEHWNGGFPYEDGPVAVYAPQHTHPHPSFSPDGSRVVFTSDCSGHAQVYEVEIENDCDRAGSSSWSH